MEKLEEKNNNYKAKSKFINFLVNSYLSIVLILGLGYLIESRGGNIATILSYIKGDTNIGTQALIYTSILELIFIIFAILGSLLLLILFNYKYTKLLIIYICIQLITSVSYIFSRITLIMGILQITSNGMIKNTDFLNMPFILQYYFSTTEFLVITVFLIVGIAIFAPIINIYNRSENK